MINFSEYNILNDYEFSRYLEEKLIVLNKGKREGQIVFLAGGAGSGKGFVVKNFLENEKFKVRDVDEWKKAFLKLAKYKNKFADLKGLNLKEPNDVFRLHMFIKNLGIKEKTLDLLLSDVKKDRLPNILFDITFKEMKDVNDIIPSLEKVGYDFKNIHLVFVLADFYVALKANAERDRTVPEDIVLKTHEGATKNMIEVMKNRIPRKINGEVHVVLNNREETVFHVNAKGEKLDGKRDEQGNIIRPVVVKSFTSLKIKESGKAVMDNRKVLGQVYDWIEKNAPKSALRNVNV